MGSSTQRTGWGTKQGSDQEVLCRLVWDFSLNGQQQGVQRNLPDPFQPGLSFLVEKYHIAPITTPEADLKTILGNG